MTKDEIKIAIKQMFLQFSNYRPQVIDEIFNIMDKNVSLKKCVEEIIKNDKSILERDKTKILALMVDINHDEEIFRFIATRILKINEDAVEELVGLVKYLNLSKDNDISKINVMLTKIAEIKAKYNI